MALSPYKSSENRSRSSSYSSPIRNRIVYQEIYSVGVNTLVRSYSCDQVFVKDASGRAFQTTQIQISSFRAPEKKNHSEEKPTKPKSRQLSLEFQPESEPDEKIVTLKPVSKTSLSKMILFILATISTACVFYLYTTYKECEYVWDLEKTHFQLRDNVFGQDAALARIKSVFQIVNSTNDFHIMVFTGRIGVGKTYSSSIISQNFPWSFNKLIIHTENFYIDMHNLQNEKLSSCGCNLVIVDDLTSKSLSDAINVISSLKKIRKHNENILVIMIFTSHTEEDRNKILSELKNAYFSFYHVPFKILMQDVVKKCYIAEIQRQRIKVSNEKLTEMLEKKMEDIHFIQGPAGCKGVAEEVASFYEKYI